eukprot:scaffold5392_cov70-Phaeocystis_antarctica.AAC.2
MRVARLVGRAQARASLVDVRGSGSFCCSAARCDRCWTHCGRAVGILGWPVEDVARLPAHGRAEAEDAVVLVAAAAGRLPHPDGLAAE